MRNKRIVIGIISIVVLSLILMGIFLTTILDENTYTVIDNIPNGVDETTSNLSDLISPEEYVSNFLDSDADYYLLDVRTAQEFSGGHINGASNISHELLAGRLAELPTDKPIVLYCNSGNRSAFAADLLVDAGFTEVYDIDGGIVAWTQRNLPLEN